MHGMSASMLKPGDAVIAISNSGRTRFDPLGGNRPRCRRDVIGITYSKSPMAKRCSVRLFADTMEDPDLYRR